MLIKYKTNLLKFTCMCVYVFVGVEDRRDYKSGSSERRDYNSGVSNS